ncbi:cytochrome P450 [Artemisia annua]|uniref:Cytochrome P450 n=1 Tax=Artemisia annua TaxID=35608 RepID=A0A2U1KRC6_ARTAN|nr:cytochrome P450 [Artemisia annua]
MDLFLSLLILVGSILCYLVFGHLARIRNGVSRGNNPVPEAAGSWPIIGHLHLLAGSQVPHKVLGSLADKFGPIFTIKLGVHRVLVVSNSEVAKECLTTNDKVFASRPKAMVSELMGYNYANFGLAPYGPYWREIRKIVVLELVSQRRLQMLAHVRVSEVNRSMIDMYRTWNTNKGSSLTVKIDMKKWFGDLIVNIVVRMIFGDHFSPSEQNEDHFKKSIRTANELMGAFVPSDVIPGLRWLDLGGYEKMMKKTAKDIDGVVDGWLEEHKKMDSTEHLDECKDQVFMATLLSRVKEEFKEDHYGFSTDAIVKATCLLILATIIHGFEFQNPTNDDIDMTESPGLTSIKATPLELLVAPRLLSHLYTVSA